MDALLSAAGIPRGRVLDAGCGAGRHLEAFRRRGIPAIGIDQSGHLLTRASSHGAVVRGDLRTLPFPSRSFGMVACFFTGFGYLPTPAEDLALLAELARLVGPSGCLHLDLPNPAQVREGLVRRDARRWEGAWVVQTRRVESDLVIKEIRIERDDGTLSEYVERVRLWQPDSIELAARDLGLTPILRLGDHQGSPWHPRSPRCGLVLRRSAA
ncbi:MAG: class I SAM-dependent methyltransferase [Fibrobacteria bacterium]|nr:class I SAM-dependent methyltransferase [Fibrobacteria bacterium]